MVSDDVASLKALIGPGSVSANTGMPYKLTTLHPPLPAQTSLIDASTFALQFQVCHLIPCHFRNPDLNAYSCLKRESLGVAPRRHSCLQTKGQRSVPQELQPQSELPETSALNAPTPATPHSCGSEPQLFLPPPTAESQDVWASWGSLGWPRSGTE